jgi:streptogramin lyase
MRAFRLGRVSLLFAVLLFWLVLPANALESARFSYAQVTLETGFTDASGVAVDARGNVYVTVSFSTSVLQIPVGCSSYSCTVALGSGFASPQGIAVDASGNIFVADTYNHAVKEIVAVNGSIPSSPTINTLGGGFTFNGEPWGIALDSSGNLYVAVAEGNGTGGNSDIVCELMASGGYNTVKKLGSGFSGPSGVAVDASGNVFVADMGHQAVKEIVAVNGSIPSSPTINTLGSGFTSPYGVAVDASGNVYVADTYGETLKEIVAVNGSIPASPTINTLLSGSSDTFNTVAVDAGGNLYITDYVGGHVLELQMRAVNFGTVAVGQTSAAIPLTFTFESGATIGSPVALTMGATGQDFAVQTPAGGSQCVAGTLYSAGDTCTVYATLSPLAPGVRRGAVMLYDASTPPKPLATAYIWGVGVGPAVAFGPGTITTAAGNGTGGYKGDGGAATSAELWQPSGVAVDGAGNLYIGDNSNGVVRKVNAATGVITTVAGTGVEGFSGDGGPATSANMGGAYSVGVDGAGNLYVSDVDNVRIRKVSAATGVITTVAGNGAEGYSGDGGAATSATLFYPSGVAVDGAGNLYIADAFDDCIREVSAATGIINTVAGNGTAGYSGDGGAATSAELHAPYGIAVDGAGNLYIADSANSSIRKVSVGTGIISTVAGNGTGGYKGDGGAATSAELWQPSGVAVDGAGNLYIGDTVNYVVRKVNAATGIITSLVGNGTGGYSGDGGAPTSAELRFVSGLAVDGAGNLYVADRTNNRIRKVKVSDVPSLTFSSTKTGSVSTSQDVVIENLGNAQLVFTTISAAANFSLGGSDTSCAASGQLLNSAASCTLGIEFAPQGSGLILGSVVLTDNALNVSGATQQIALSGTGQSSATTTSVIVGTSPSGLSFSVDGTNYTSTQTLTWNIGDSHTIAATSLQTSGGTQNTFASWSDGGAILHLVTASASTTSYTATFSTSYQLTTAASPAAGGTVTPNSGSYYASGTVVNLSAAPNSGYAFSSWTGNVANANSASTTVTMNAAQSVTANFTSGGPVITTGDFGTVAVGQTSATMELTFSLNGISSLSSPVALTMGATGQDFAVQTLVGGNQCVAGSDYSSATYCDVYVTFTPKFTGLRKGAVELLDGSGNIIATAYVYGIGSGPQLGFLPRTKSTLGGGFSAPSGVAVDGSGNVFVADQINNTASEIPPDCASASCVKTLAGTFNLPEGVAVDASGNVLVADYSNLTAYQILARGGYSTVQDFVSGGLFYGVAVDASGDVFLTQIPNGNSVSGVLELPAKGSSVQLGQKAGIVRIRGDATSGGNNLNLNYPVAAAVDGNGNIFVADSGNNAIYEISAAGKYATAVAIGSGFSAPTGVAVDGNGNVFVADTGNKAVKEILVAGGYTTVNTIASVALENAAGIALDSSGNLYLTGGSVVKLDIADPSPLTFTTPTTVGTTDANDGPLKVTIQNIGKGSTTLNLTGIAVASTQPGTNFTIDGGATTCTTSTQLTLGTSCVVGVDFTPTASGALTGTLTLTDNALNVSGATQQIALSGTGQSSATTTLVTVGTSPAGLSFSVDGTNYTTSQTIAWNIGDSHTIATTSPQTSSGTQNTFSSWSDGGALLHLVTASASTTSYTATFNTAYQLTTAASPADGGTVTPASGSYYAFGTVVNLSATPNSGYAFSSWTGNVANANSASTTVTMSAAQSVTANFSTTSPAVTLTPTVLSFGSQTDGTTSTAQNVVLKNSGTAPLSITAIAVTGTNAANFVESDNCVSTSPLAANATCTIAVKFAPTTPGNDTASVSVTDNATGSPQGVTLSGTGTAPPAPIASLTPASLSFSTTNGTSSASQAATLSNTGNAALTISSITIGGANPSDFSETNNCGTSLAAGSICSITVTFTPASVTSFSATLTVTDNAAGSPQTATLSGTGTAPDYGVNSSTPAQTVTAGGTATYNINVQSIGAYNGSVSLAVTGLPAGATATFTPNPVTLGSIGSDVSRRAAVSNPSGTSILTVQTSGAKFAQSRARWPLIAPIFGFLMLLPARRLHRQYLSRFLIILTILGSGVALVGCGGGFAIAPQSKTYTLTITGTSGAVTHSTTVLLTVK